MEETKSESAATPESLQARFVELSREVGQIQYSISVYHARIQSLISQMQEVDKSFQAAVKDKAPKSEGEA